MRQIVLDSAGLYRRAAVLQDQTPVAFYAAPENQAIHVNDLLIVKVSDVKPGLDGVFVRLPYGLKGFLPKKEWEPFASGKPMDALRSGDVLLLQVKREPIGNKQAILTRNIQIKGQTIIYLPFGNYVAVSHQIEEKKREQVKQTAEAWIQFPEGAILRSTFPSCPEEAILKEWSHLKEKWDKLIKEADAATPPCCLSSAPFLAAELVSLIRKNDIQVWVTNDNEEAIFLEKLGEVVTYDESPDLFQNYQLEKAWAGALKPWVHLKSGISLIIEETQALTSIDVNTGSFKGAKSKEETAYIGNLEAVEAIARELSLRQIGGIILIDLLKMEEPAHREDVLTRFKSALRHDFSSTYIAGYTGLGLLELTRKKTRYSLSRLASSRNHD